ncbi:PQQ-like beta-propeller repeat protein [Streptomyces sp. NBC_01239]|uniref:outer membrane protein assembly factor BamB family protein n=1 Tax=Streptomyces sp. NBC_01239 TaxID=2903792 RepID=UPI00224DA9F8|nr:PQQ-binding-like beta-propeller repeat protein [Streptomyces sp. NBC_01239]MCX4814297.1 PQQ-like beta-propeller repeat protein [Streptomyces sp. NBC_01239]
MSFGPPPSPYTHSVLTQNDQQKKRRRNRLLGLLAVVLVAAVGTAGLLAARSDDKKKPTADNAPAAGGGRLDVRDTVERKPATTTGDMAFRFSIDDAKAGEHTEMPGTWATDKILAKGINQTLVGFSTGTDAVPGDEVWKLRLAGPICGYTRRVTGENRTAVVFRDSKDKASLCNHVAFFDLDDGKQIWEHEFPVSRIGDAQGTTPTDGAVQDTPSVTLTHATVAVTWGGGTDAYDMDSGERTWRTTESGSCQDMGAAGGRALLVRLECWDDSQASASWQTITYKVRKVDPATGKEKWTYAGTKGLRDLELPSSDPPVVAVSAGETGFTELLSLDDRGTVRATIGLTSGSYVGDCSDQVDYLVVDDCQTIAVGLGQVFVRSKKAGAPHTSNWIIGFDLATGKTTEKFESGPNSLLYPLRVSGSRLLALRMSDDRISPSALVSLDPKTGKETPYLYFGVPQDADTLTTLDENDIVVQDGRLFFAAHAADGPSSGKAWTWLVLGIGSSATEQ